MIGISTPLVLKIPTPRLTSILFEQFLIDNLAISHLKEVNKSFEIKNYLKDHRIMAMFTIAALTLGGKWKIHNPESINTSFPSFFRILKKDLKSNLNI